jgi:hypothetical protein
VRGWEERLGGGEQGSQGSRGLVVGVGVGLLIGLGLGSNLVTAADEAANRCVDGVSPISDKRKHAPCRTCAQLACIMLF